LKALRTKEGYHSIVNAGAGNDKIFADSDDLIDGGAGDDTVSYEGYRKNLILSLATNLSADAAFKFRLETSVQASSASKGYGYDVEKIVTGIGSDTLVLKDVDFSRLTGLVSIDLGKHSNLVGDVLDASQMPGGVRVIGEGDAFTVSSQQGGGSFVLLGAENIKGSASDDYFKSNNQSNLFQGGSGVDTYVFDGSFGKDRIIDSDGQGSIEIDGLTLSGKANGSGKPGINEWTLKQGNQVFSLLLDMSTGVNKLIITKGTDKNNSITIDNFDFAAAQAGGFLGIQLGEFRLALMEGSGATPFADPDFDLSTATGSVTINEGGSKVFAFYLDRPAKAGDTLTLSLSDLADKFKVILGDDIVAANGAVITLLEGQDRVLVSLVQVGDVDEDGSTQLTAIYQGAGAAVTSTAWTIALDDAGDVEKTYIGDQRALIRGSEIDPGLPATDPGFDTYKWSATTWASDGTLLGGIVEEDFNDVIYGAGGRDKISGMGGNDALDGLGGDDQIDGGVGDDLIGGGAGSDTIHGGAGKDVILGATGLGLALRRPDDDWAPPNGGTVWAQGSNWGVYDSGGGSRTIEGGGSTFMDSAGDVVDAG
ncbi:MAG: hypothetical protein JF626_08100, partial [Polaromonas sp.]|nr:hypothetical protein [Polaromonas sp.]